MRQALYAFAFVCASIVAQDMPRNGPVTLTSSTPPDADTRLWFYDGSNNLIYECRAASKQPTYTWAITPGALQGTLTSIVDAANTSTVNITAHGLQVGNRVTIAGSSTSALNGTYVIQTVPNANSFTVTTSGVPDATYTDAAMTLATTAPRSSAAIWAIKFFQYSGTNVTIQQWAEGRTSFTNICDNRATLAYN